METCKLKGACKNYIWGGNKLKKIGKDSNDESIAESWELSFLKDGLCKIDSGINKGKYLADIVSSKDLGTYVTTYPFFPVLVKLIDSKENLSVQVHPNDEYALKHENSFGKTEMWYILEAEENAKLYLGFKNKSSKEQVLDSLKNNRLLELLNAYNVKQNDCFIIESGTIHAIGAGITLLEIQQNSNLTYRLYDYQRVDKNGKLRELHIDKALEVIDYSPYKPLKEKKECLISCKYFSVYKKDSTIKDIQADESSFITLTITNGEGFINDLPCKKWDTFFIPATKHCTLKGQFEFVLTTIERPYSSFKNAF